MLFSIQVFIENYLSRRGIIDSDGFSVKLAHLFFYKREVYSTEQAFLKKARRINSTVFVANPSAKDILVELVRQLDQRFQKKTQFPGGTKLEQKRLARKARITLNIILDEFCSAIEARATDGFWLSRRRGELRSHPEKIAQDHLVLFVKGVLREGGIVFSEFSSGTGYVDVGILISKSLHLVELKVLSKGKFKGPAQLAAYMRHEKRVVGTLIVFDARKKKDSIVPKKLVVPEGTVNIRVLDLNPISPSRLKS